MTRRRFPGVWAYVRSGAGAPENYPATAGKGNFSQWEYGRCEKYQVYTEDQMRETIRDLVTRKHILRQMKQELNVDYWLEIVPWVYPGESTPALAPPQDVIAFCHETGTRIDIDLYVGE